MSDQAATPGGSGDERNKTPDTLDDDREAAMMRDVRRPTRSTTTARLR